MNVLFLTRRAWPKVGGVEKHISEVSQLLRKKGHKVNIISEEDIHYPRVKYIGLIYIWLWFLRNIKFIKEADIIHCHDVFIWYLPFRFFYPFKKVITTFHGWEGNWPIPKKNIIIKKIAACLSNKTIAVGDYIVKHYKIHVDEITYGGFAGNKNWKKSTKKGVVIFVGRLDNDTGIDKFISSLSEHKYKEVIFLGDGKLKKICKNYGRVFGFTNPIPFYKNAEYCVPGGYLAALEAVNLGCKMRLYWNTKIKEDYWKMSPFYKLKDKNLTEWAAKQTWELLTEKYIDLYN